MNKVILCRTKITLSRDYIQEIRGACIVVSTMYAVLHIVLVQMNYFHGPNTGYVVHISHTVYDYYFEIQFQEM